MNNKIPKIVHYIWFGGNPKSELILNCIESWKKYLPDYEFKEWNENNYDVNKCPFIKEAYENKKYAFAADYARFDILYEYGGIYLDTDVELLKRIPDDYLNFEGFAGVESNNRINPGLIFAVMPKNPLVLNLKENYEKKHFINGKKQDLTTVVDYTTDLFKKYGFQENNKRQTIKNFEIFPVDYFCAFDFTFKEFNITENTISIHHYAFTWGSKTQKFYYKFKIIIKNIIGKKNYKKLVDLKHKILKK